MRRPHNHLDAAAARQILAEARVHRLAGTDADGNPMLRSLNGAVLGDALYFHGAPAGEKARALGRPVVAAADDVVAEIPSHWIDPQLACPASTWYRSAQVKGTLTRVDDLDEKAAALQALMSHRQPEGGYVPITAHDPRYAKVVRGLLVMKVPFEVLTGKMLLGQGRPERIAGVLAGLWDRGAVTDARALELVRAQHPAAKLPARFAAPSGFSLHVWTADPGEVADLLAGEYWTAHLSRADLCAKYREARAWVGVRDAEGHLVGTASAIADGRRAWLMDVRVVPAHRGRGLARAAIDLLLDHPLLRHARVGLQTRDAMGLYRALGFAEAASGGPVAMWRTAR